MPLYSICIATYQRPEGLLDLLESIEAQQLTDDMSVEIIVVDNDPRSSETVVRDFGERSRFPVQYLTQPEQNISLTRNVAVAAASGEFIWFVDDDETAIPECLARLSAALHEFDAAGVFGPVIPVFETEQPEWVEKSSVFNRPIGVTGGKAHGYRTSNTLVRTDALALVEGPFDADFGISGGSDSMLFRELAAKGLRFIDSGDAFVSEVVPSNRATWSWMRTRFRRQGQNYARQTVMLNGGVWTKPVMWMLCKALVQIPLTLAGIAISWPNRYRRSEWQLRMWSNIGKFEGVRGTTSVRAH
ncbi:MAG: glycosyltransferase family 2 protein [Acidimicrobiia bacterium]|nr:glycosyltransferase family 2 protein [Acidimicrobiia bacterium]